MSPAKDEGSSAIRGKKLLLMILLPNCGRRNSSLRIGPLREGGKGMDPNSDCHPLINPWYDTHIHFPMVPGDYLSLWYEGFLGPFGFHHSRSWYTLRDITPRAHPLWIWVGYFLGLEGVGVQGVVWCGFHGGVIAGRCVESHRFISVLV